MTGELYRLLNPVSYDGSNVVIIANNQIAYTGDVSFPADTYKNELIIENVFHLPGIGKNLFSIPQITSFGKYVLLGPDRVHIFDEFETISKPVLIGSQHDSVYGLSAETTFVDKTKGRLNADLWHSRFGHVCHTPKP